MSKGLRDQNRSKCETRKRWTRWIRIFFHTGFQSSQSKWREKNSKIKYVRCLSAAYFIIIIGIQINETDGIDYNKWYRHVGTSRAFDLFKFKIKIPSSDIYYVDILLICTNIIEYFSKKIVRSKRKKKISTLLRSIDGD